MNREAGVHIETGWQFLFLYFYSQMTRLILTILFLGWMALPAQELVFCLDHTREGAPLAADTEFELDQFGQELDLLLRNGHAIQTPKLYFFIDRMVDTVYVEHDTRSIMTPKGSKWASVKYKFDRTGQYRVVVLDADKLELCRAEVKVNVLRDVGGPSYYRDAEVKFCWLVQDGQPDKQLRRVHYETQKKHPIKVLIKHFRPLRTHSLTVDVWKKGMSEDEYMESIEFEVEPHWTFTQFEYTFKSRGVFFVRVYSEDEVWMASGRLAVD